MTVEPLVLVLVTILCAESGLARTSESLKVKINSGSLVGRHLTTHNGQPIRAFMGIPYAQPPVGELRFKVCSSVSYNLVQQKC